MTVIFSLAAFFVNAFPIPLMFGVDFLFGGVMSYLAFRVLGWQSGLIVAFSGAIQTFFLWNHFYAVALFSLEMIAVAFLFVRFGWGLISAAIGYWLFVGLPLAYTAYLFGLELTEMAARVIGFKQALNGIVNAVVAELFFIFLGLLMSKRRRQSFLTLSSVVQSGFMLACAVPMLIATAWYSSLVRVDSHRDFQLSMGSTLNDFKYRVDQWVVESAYGAISASPALAAQWDSSCQAPSPKEVGSKGLRFVGGRDQQPLVNMIDGFALDGDSRLSLEIRASEGRYGLALSVEVNLPACGSSGYLLFESDYQSKYMSMGQFSSTGLSGLRLVDQAGHVLFSQGEFPPQDELGFFPDSEQAIDGLMFARYLPVSASSLVQAWYGSVLFGEAESLVAPGWIYAAAAPYTKQIIDIQSKQAWMMAIALGLIAVCWVFGGWVSRSLLTPQQVFLVDAYKFSPEERREKARKRLFGWLWEIDELIGKLAGYERAAMDSVLAKEKQFSHSRRLASQLEEFVAGANVPIFSVDRNGEIQEWNARAETLTGFSAAQVRGQDLVEWFISRQEEDGVRAVLEKACSGIGTSNVPVSFLTHDGGSMRVILNVSPNRDEEGEVVGATLVAQDVTELSGERDQLFALASSRSALLQAVFDLSPDAVVSIDAGGRIEYVNRALHRMLGITEVDAFEHSEDWLNEQIRQRAVNPELLGSLVADQEGMSEIELQSPRPSVLWRSQRIERDVHGGIVRKILYFRDVTREKEVQRIKSEFLTTAAHELRTPMASIFGFSELLLHRNFDSKTHRDIVNSIHRQTGVMVNLINELLDLSRIEAKGQQEIRLVEGDVCELIEDVAKDLNIQGDEREVILSLPSNLPRVRFDPEKFGLAITNVLSNAYKFSPLGGDIVVTASKVERLDREALCIEVSDQGVGMTSVELERVFERFYRADKVVGIPGTGLGMAFVHEVVRLHNGDIEIDSEPGVGTTVRLLIPLVQGASSSKTELES